MAALADLTSIRIATSYDEGDILFSERQEATGVFRTAIDSLAQAGIPAKFGKWLSFYDPVESGIRLIPDGYVEILTAKEPLAAFLEVDLGYESLSVWKTKVDNYLRYAVTGNFEKRFDLPQFRVLVVTNTDRRMHSLRAATLSLTEKIFWFSTLESVAGIISLHPSQCQMGIRWPHQSCREMHQSRMLSSQFNKIVR